MSTGPGEQGATSRPATEEGSSTGGTPADLQSPGGRLGGHHREGWIGNFSFPEAANFDKAVSVHGVLCVLQAKRMERQLKQVHERVVQQRESLCHLKAENLEMQRLRVSSCGNVPLTFVPDLASHELCNLHQCFHYS